MNRSFLAGLVACCVTTAHAVDVAPPAAADPAASDSATLLGELLEPLASRPGAPQLSANDVQLYARPLPLLEALERSGDRSRRLWIAQAYWKVSAAHAQIRCGTEAIERLELIAPGGDPHDRATLDVAVAAARADLADARALLGVAQQELVDLARLPLADPLPWPVDRPLAGPYQTHFDAIFASRTATGRIRAIARTLPSRHEALESRAAAVRAATKAMAMAEADHAKGQRPIEAVIAAHAAVVSQQREFLQATKAYNLDIAEYAMAVADASVPDDRFVSMLIGTPIQWRQPPPAPPPSSPPPASPAAAAAPAASGTLGP
jgi:outer membrane protein TolC